jgi:hypothetical protein
VPAFHLALVRHAVNSIASRRNLIFFILIHPISTSSHTLLHLVVIACSPSHQSSYRAFEDLTLSTASFSSHRFATMQRSSHSAMDLTGSPKKKMSASFTIYEDSGADASEPVRECRLFGPAFNVTSLTGCSTNLTAAPVSCL